MTASTNKTLLSKELRTEMWLALASRLRDGEPMYSNSQFEEVLLEIYQQVTGQEAPESVCDEIRAMVSSVNRDHPETYLVHGVKNGITKAFEQGVRRQGWDLNKIQSFGARALKKFSQQDTVRDLLEDANLSAHQISVAECLQQVIEQVAPRQDRRPEDKVAQAPTFRPDLAPPVIEAEPPSAAVQPQIDAGTQAAIAAGDVDADTARARTEEGEKRQSEIEATEMAKVPERLHRYVTQGIVTEEEADQLRQLSEVDARVKKGEINEDEAHEIRNSILGKGVRDKLERKVREAVADSSRYLQVFESMKKIDPKYHDAIAFLIQHKNLVAADEGSAVDLGPAIRGLMEDVELLDDTIDIMERKDQELRMISVRLHPYSAIMSRGIERIGNMTVEEGFVDDLAQLSLDEMSDRLSSEDQLVRVKPAADMRCLISLVDHVSKRTRFRKELRLLRIAKQLEDFYKNTTDIKEARHQAEGFLNRRLRRLFPDMNADEAADIKQRSTEMMDQIEQRILDERKAVVEAKRAKTEAATSARADTGGDGDEDMELSEEEVNKGVQIGRVEMRVAGSTRRIPTKIMPDPDDPERMLIAVRDRDTGVVEPATRRGQKRYVERTREGYWAEAR